MPSMVTAAMALEAMVENSQSVYKKKRVIQEGEPGRKRARQDDVHPSCASSIELPPRNEEGEVVVEEEDARFVDAPPTPISRPSSARPKRYICTYPQCNKAYARPKALAEHVRSHTNDRPFACTESDCSKTFRREDHLRRHIQIAHKNERNYICTWDGCEKRFCDSAKLKTHMAVHEGREKFKCTGFEGCQEWFRKRETLRAHVAMVHQQQKPYSCDYIDELTGEKCEHGYTTALKLAEHKKKTHKPARYCCQMCPPENAPPTEPLNYAIFHTYASLQEHIRTVHPPTCQHCNKPFVSARALAQHVELTHSTADNLDARRTFVCNFSGCHGNSSYGFTRRSNLNAHVRQVHEGVRPYVCGETDLSKSKKCSVDGISWDGVGACGKACQTKHHLEEHVRTAHLGLEWTQVTTKREKRAAAGLPADARLRAKPTTLSQLTGHDYAEEPGRHIECLITNCQYRFFREYDLRQHCQSTHGMAVVEYVETLHVKGSEFAELYEMISYDRDEEIERELDEEMGISGLEKVDIRTGNTIAAPTKSMAFNTSRDEDGTGTLFPWTQDESVADQAPNRLLLAFTLDPQLEAHDQTLQIAEADGIIEQLQG